MFGYDFDKNITRMLQAHLPIPLVITVYVAICQQLIHLVSDISNISYTKVQSHEEVSEGQVGDEEPGDVHLRPSKHEDDDNGAIAKECQQKHHPHTTPQSPPVKEVLARHEWTCVVLVGSYSQFHAGHFSKYIDTVYCMEMGAINTHSTKSDTCPVYIDHWIRVHMVKQINILQQ